MSKKTGTRSDPLQYFWILLGCCTMSAASMGVCIYSSGVFFDAVSAGLGLTLGEVSLTTTWTMLSMAIMTLFIPYLFKFVRYRWVLTGAAALCLIGVLGMSFSFNVFWLDFFSILKGVGAACFGLVPVTYIIANWFPGKQDIVTGLAVASSAIGAAFMVWVLGHSVAGLGWRMGYVIQAILVGVLLLPPFLLPYTLKPAGLGLDPYGTAPASLKKGKSGKRTVRNLVYLAIIAVLASFTIAVPQFFGNYASSLGQQVVVGISLLSWAMVGNFLFKVIGGFVAERIGIIYTSLGLALIVLVGDLGMALCAISYSSFTIAAMALLFGACYGLAELCLPLLVSYFFGKARYIRIYSIVSAFSLATAAIAIGMLGNGLDLNNNYGWIWLLVAIFMIAIMAMLWLMSGHTFEGLYGPAREKKESVQPSGTHKKAQTKEEQPAAQPVYQEVIEEVDISDPQGKELAKELFEQEMMEEPDSSNK